MRLRPIIVVIFITLFFMCAAHAQSPDGTISGTVYDPLGKLIAGAEVTVVNDATRVQKYTKTNNDGVYVIPNLTPGSYRLQVAKPGFKTLIKPDITLNVQDVLAINFTLPIGSAAETVTVEGGAPLINTQDATVSTVVDRQFAENLPLNGRSFQTLIQLTPGVVLTANNASDEGQFSINGQRGTSNYWTVDGVSANIGIGANFSAANGLAGSLGSFSVLGGTNSLVSVDALQEFRIQTSTYAPEFGRTPGGQISIVTRSGTNQYHGTLFDYLRNDVLDANDWFADANQLAKPEERQNDFGGTLGGRILKNRTFFFFSYEGLRLRLPQTKLTTVPDLNARQSAVAAVQPFLNAYPVPNGTDNLATGVAGFNASFSNPASLDAYSLRIDHKLSDNLVLFGRYDYSPSSIVERGSGTLDPLTDLEPISITTQTGTVGLTWAITSFTANDFRFNYSRTNSASGLFLDDFGGGVPLKSLPLPSPFNAQNSFFSLAIFSLANGDLTVGSSTRNVQNQINLIDTVSLQKDSHSLKFGADYRRLQPSHNPSLYTQDPLFLDVPSAAAGSLLAVELQSLRNSTFLLQNLGMFAQDTWRVTRRLTVTYGLRWDLDFAPSSINGPSIPAVTGYNLGNLANLALAPAGAPAFSTTYGNVAPRLGVAYQVSQKPDWERVLRGGFGVFYDLATSEVGGAVGTSYPFGASALNFGGTFPVNASLAAPPAVTPSELSSPGAILSAFDPKLQLPYTLEWNVALEQGLGKQQTLSVSYVGSSGRRLLQTALVTSPTPSFSNAALIGNTASSNYNALQVQFQRRLTNGLQTLASYSWSHSIDTGSAGSFANGANTLVPTINPNANRGDSDFDIRNAFSAAVTYDVPTLKSNAFAKGILGGWSFESVIQARSAVPVTVFDGLFAELLSGQTEIRPDVVPGQPFYLYSSKYPGGKALNPAAFTAPPTDSAGNPLRQGDLGRNALRGFGATQWDFAAHRDFPLRESLKLQFRAELFNVLNHPNFAPPVADINNTSQFGTSIQMLGQYLGGANVGGGGFNSLYQLGGPRSIQLALKLMF